MSALQLLGYICAALLLQMAAGLGFTVWNRLTQVAASSGVEATDSPAPAKGAWNGWRDFRVLRREFEDPARSQCSFYLQPLDGAALTAFLPGQYLTFSLPVGQTSPDPGSAARDLVRCYSLSDRPDPAGYRITVKRALPPPGRSDLPAGVSSTHFHDHVHAGDVLKVKAPAGHFFIDPDANVSAVLVAGGIGITPMMSMLAWCVAEQPGRTVHLHYGVRSSADHAFKQVLEDLARNHPAFRLHVSYSHPGPGDVQGLDYQHAGRIDLALLRSCLPHGRHQFHVCGPPAMMQSLVPALREWGVPEEDIRFEAFGPATVRPAAPANNEPAAGVAVSIDVRFSGSGRTLVWDGQDANLLDFAERQGLTLESGCRSGSCGTCEVRLVSGEVGYAQTPDHDIAKGHCLPCVGRPKSALVIDA